MIGAQSANMNVSDYCAAMARHEIKVNREYQRSDRVWPDPAKSYLIESILLGYPVPKFYLHLTTDPKNRTTTKEIVDGQQRSVAIREFLNDAFALSNTLDTEEIRGFKYSTLPEIWQGKFLSYILSIDQFVGADSAEVRQIFRRMNSYTVPLNPEELRHAENQGEFKWFISRIGLEYTESLIGLGVFSSKAAVRMQDLKLYAEIADALDRGVTTTSRRDLDKIYRRYDAQFPRSADFQAGFDYAFSKIGKMSFIGGTNLAKPYQLYSLALAFMEERRETADVDRSLDAHYSRRVVETGLLNLSAALDLSEDQANRSPLKDFISASRDRTNVKDQRIKRIDAFRGVLKEAYSVG